MNEMWESVMPKLDNSVGSVVITSTPVEFNELNEKLMIAANKIAMNSRYGKSNYIVGRSDKGPTNKPIYINNSLFGTPHDPMYEKQSEGRYTRTIKRTIKRTISDLDPYGEENWDQ